MLCSGFHHLCSRSTSIKKSKTGLFEWLQFFSVGCIDGEFLLACLLRLLKRDNADTPYRDKYSEVGAMVE